MDIIAEIRRRHFVSGETISSIARSLNISRPTVRKHLHREAEPVYERQVQPEPRLGEFKAQLIEWLEADAKLPKHQRRTAQRLFEGLVNEGYQGAYDSIQRFVKHWKSDHRRSPSVKQAFIPLAFQPGEVCQFDWSQETVEIQGIVQTVKVAHFRLAYSRKMFVMAFPRETQEMVMEAHNQAFAFYGGVPKQMVYDNLKAVVDTVFVGKERKFNRRFMTLANHYLFEPVACTPAAGWEKGQIENQVGNVREWLFTPRAKFATLAALNAWLGQRCEELANRQHPTLPSQTIADCFAQEQALLRPVTQPFAGYIEQLAKVSKLCLIRWDRNAYSVPAEWVGKVVSVRVTAYQIRIVAEGQTIAEHARCFSYDQLICNPWHYLPVLEKKPGALRHGAPFQDWELPKAIQQVRNKLLRQSQGDRAFVDCLLLAREHGLDALETACELVLESGVVTGSLIQNAMRRLTEPDRPKELTASQHLQLKTEPQANPQRYDHLLGVRNVH
ncbi:MAG: IS21 family transposase [Methylosarcina sp.]